jgi:hypothetical protein
MNRNANVPSVWATFLLLATVSSCSVFAQGDGSTAVAEPVEYVRIWTDQLGDSHFADEELPFELAEFAPPAPPISVTDSLAADSVAFLSSPPGWHGNWHPAPSRQFFLVLSGELEVEVSDGEVRRFVPGSIVLLEDTSGRGHVSRVVGEKRCYGAVVPLNND